VRGYVERRGEGSYRLKVYAGRDAEGRRRYLTKTIRTTSKREAERRLADFIVESGLGAHDVTNATVADLVFKWLAVVAEPNFSPSTLAEYRRLISKEIVPRIGKTKLRALRASDLDGLYADLRKRGLSPASVHHVHSLLRAILNQGVKWGWLATNPAKNATPPRVAKHELDIPEPDEVLLLIGGADPDLGTYLRLAAVTGARRGELNGLRWSDVDFVGGALSITRAVVGKRNEGLTVKETKTGSRRTIALDPETIDALAHHRNRFEDRAELAGVVLSDEAYIFSPDVAGRRPWRPDGISLAFRRLRKDLGLRDFRLHDLRHAAATRMLAAGVPVRTVAGRLGHANATTTLNTYGHWVQASDQVAASVLGDLLGGKAPTSPPPPGARRQARGAGTRPRSGAK
jgi:integrase